MGIVGGGGRRIEAHNKDRQQVQWGSLSIIILTPLAGTAA